MKKFVCFFCLTLLIILISINHLFTKEKTYSQSEFLMDTYIKITVYGEDQILLEKAVSEAFKKIERIASLTNRYADSQTSIISEINAQAGLEKVFIKEDDVWEILVLAKEYSLLYPGVFDATIGPVVDLWGFGHGTEKVPEEDELKDALILVNIENFVLENETRTAFLRDKGMSLDVGALAKGYAVEKAACILEQAGIKKALINAGGNIHVLGRKQKNLLWQIGIQDPRNLQNVMGILSLENEAVVTSGDYERYFKQGEDKYHHLISPLSGYPATNNISVTVIAPNSSRADALSTILFIMKPQDALELVESLADIEAVIVTADHRILLSSGIKSKVKIIPGKEYSYESS